LVELLGAGTLQLQPGAKNKRRFLTRGRTEVSTNQLRPEQFRKSVSPERLPSPHDFATTEGLLLMPGIGITGDPPSHGMMWQANNNQQTEEKYG
jgi:hypothetical protein